jgi:hypothetical protein
VARCGGFTRGALPPPPCPSPLSLPPLSLPLPVPPPLHASFLGVRSFVFPSNTGPRSPALVDVDGNGALDLPSLGIMNLFPVPPGKVLPRLYLAPDTARWCVVWCVVWCGVVWCGVVR